MSKPTPWPWVACLGPRGSWSLEPLSTPPGSFVIAWRPEWDTRENESFANARLISAAPEMKDALEEAPVWLIGESERAFIDRYAEWYRSKRNPALAKSEGEP